MEVKSSGSSAMIESIRRLVVQSGMLPLTDYVNLHLVLRKEYNWEEYWTYASPENDGQRRFKIWRHCLMSAELLQMSHVRRPRPMKVRWGYDVEDEAPVPTFDDIKELYLKAISTIDIATTNKFSSGQTGEIIRDVVRTYQTHCLFAKDDSIGRRMLARILLAFAQSHPSVGYCQGMNFVVGALIVCRLTSNDDLYALPDCYQNLTDDELLHIECEVFELLVLLVRPAGKFRMCGLWAERIPRLKMRVYQLDRLMRWHLPQLQQHFTSMQLSPEVLATQWFLTLFAYNIPLPLLLSLYDYLFVTGWCGMYTLSVSMLLLLQQQLLRVQDMEGVAIFLKKWKISNTYHGKHAPPPSPTPPSSSFPPSPDDQLDVCDFSLHALLRRGDRLGITEEVLAKLQEGYAYELLAVAELRRAEYAQQAPPPSPSNADPSAPPAVAAGVGADPAAVATPTGEVLHSKDYLRRAAQRAAREDASRGVAARRVVERPTYWLLRYAYKLGPETVEELHGIFEELLRLEHSIDEDKETLQAKIKAVCDLHRAVDEEVQALSYQVAHLTQQRFVLESQLARHVAQAQEAYRAAAHFLEHVSVDDRKQSRGWFRGVAGVFSRSPPRPTHTAATHTPTPTPTPTHTPPAAGHEQDTFPYLPSLHTGPLRHLLLQHRLQNTKFLNNELQALVQETLARRTRSGSVGEEADGDELQPCDVTGRDSGPGEVSPTPSAASSPAVLSPASLRSGSGALAQGRQLKQLEQQSQEAQQLIINDHKALDDSRRQLALLRKNLDSALLQEEELATCKRSLCDQLQLLVEDSNRGRAQKLLFVAEHFIV